VPADALAKLDPRRVFGPFVRCVDVLVPQWTTMLEIPDLTFEVTQDVDGDGAQEVIYSEGLFDVRWDATSIADVVLRADASAIAGPSCDIPDVGPCGEPAILFASNYPLQVAGNPSVYHDGSAATRCCPTAPTPMVCPARARGPSRRRPRSPTRSTWSAAPSARARPLPRAPPGRRRQRDVPERRLRPADEGRGRC
jgi:hypothetical protein